MSEHHQAPAKEGTVKIYPTGNGKVAADVAELFPERRVHVSVDKKRQRIYLEDAGRHDEGTIKLWPSNRAAPEFCVEGALKKVGITVYEAIGTYPVHLVRNGVFIDLSERVERGHRRFVARRTSLRGHVLRRAVKTGISISEIRILAKREGKNPDPIIRMMRSSEHHGREVIERRGWIKLGQRLRRND
jgi:hypothetical protein